MSRQVGWGVIGAGGIADRRTIPEGILPASNAKLVAVMSSNPERSSSIGAKYGVPAYTQVEDLLKNSDVEIVYIATPNYLHKPQSLECAAAGKHVFCEKPLGMSGAEAEEIADACRKAGVKLGVGFMMRFNAYHRHFKELIEVGALGTVVFARAQLTCWYPPIAGAWRQDPRLGGGGALMDLTVHCVDLLEMLLGPVSEVSAFIENRVQDYPSDDTNALLLKFENGALGFVDTAFNIPDEASENVLEIQGSKGCIKARMTIGQGEGGHVNVCSLEDGGGYDAAQKRAGGTYEPLVLNDLVNPYRAQVEAFSNAVLKNTEPPVGSAAGVRSLHILEAAQRAAKTGQMQRIL